MLGGEVVTENLRIRSANPTDADELLPRSTLHKYPVVIAGPLPGQSVNAVARQNIISSSLRRFSTSSAAFEHVASRLPRLRGAAI